MIRKNKRGQEEIVGFVIIIVIVSIIALIFLGINLRKPQDTRNSVVLENYLQAMIGYTTDCETEFDGNYKIMSEVIKMCYNTGVCKDERKACEVLEEYINEIMSTSFSIDEENPENLPTKYYKIRTYYTEYENGENGINEEIITLEKGDCTAPKVGAEYSISSLPGVIITEIEVCKE